jgi:hypothetical protein
MASAMQSRIAMNERAEALKKRTKKFTLDVSSEIEGGICRDKAAFALLDEADQLSAIFAASSITASEALHRTSIRRRT